MASRFILENILSSNVILTERPKASRSLHYDRETVILTERPKASRSILHYETKYLQYKLRIIVLYRPMRFLIGDLPSYDEA